MKHALAISLDLTVLAVLAAFCCQWTSLGLRFEPPRSADEPAVEAPAAAPEDAMQADEMQESAFIQLARLSR